MTIKAQTYMQFWHNT